MRTPENVEKLKAIIEKYLVVVNNFIQTEIELQKRGKKLNDVQRVANDFLSRTFLNVKAVLELLELYKIQRGMILPIGLILRSICSDFLTLCYLSTFSGNKNEVNESFLNELRLFQRDSVRSVMEVAEMEIDIQRFLKGIPKQSLGKDELLKMHEKIRNNFSFLFNKKGGYKVASELRATSDKRFFYKKEFKEPNGFVTEKYKWKRIEKDEVLNKYILVYFSHKLFSQFQHYSKLSVDLLDKGAEDHMFYYLVLSIDSVFIATDLQIQIIGGNENKLLNELRMVKDQINGVF